MTEQMKLLVQLQGMDKQIFELNAEKVSKPAQVGQLESEYENDQDKLKKINEQFKSLQVKRKEGEIDLAAKEDNIKKYQIQLSSVKTNKEYSALQHEIKGLKADCSLVEDRILKIMEESEKLAQEVKIEEERLEKAKAGLQSKKEVIKRELAEIEQKLSSLTQDRKRLRSSIDSKLVSRYENIQRKKDDGLALVGVIEGICQGCNMNLTAQQVNEVMLEQGIQTCESCARLLYFES